MYFLFMCYVDFLMFVDVLDYVVLSSVGMNFYDRCC